MNWNNDDEIEDRDKVEEERGEEMEREDAESQRPWTWALLREVGTEIEAMLIAGRLHSAGIPAQVLSQVDSTRNFTVGALAIAKVYVPSHMLVHAEDLLDEDNELPDPSTGTDR